MAYAIHSTKALGLLWWRVCPLLCFHCSVLSLCCDVVRMTLIRSFSRLVLFGHVSFTIPCGFVVSSIPNGDFQICVSFLQVYLFFFLPFVLIMGSAGGEW